MVHCFGFLIFRFLRFFEVFFDIIIIFRMCGYIFGIFIWFFFLFFSCSCGARIFLTMWRFFRFFFVGRNSDWEIPLITLICLFLLLLWFFLGSIGSLKFFTLNRRDFILYFLFFRIINWFRYFFFNFFYIIFCYF